MPRNVVTLAPRLLTLPRHSNPEVRKRIQELVVERYGARVISDPPRIEIDFPKKVGRRAAKTDVMQTLDALDSRWRRVFVLYPTESALRDNGE